MLVYVLAGSAQGSSRNSNQLEKHEYSVLQVKCNEVTERKAQYESRYLS